MNQNKLRHVKPSFFIDFSKTSYETTERILNALNAEMEEAIAQKRVPILEKAFERLGPIPNRVM